VQIGLEPNARMVLYVGRIERLKGIETLLRAGALLRSQGGIQGECACVMVIGGDPDTPADEMARLQALREELGVTDVVTFVGKKNQESLPYYYSAAEVVVVPSHYESFGLVALEAMACGTPVVASGVGGLLYLVQDGRTGFHVPDGDAPLLAGKLASLLRDDEMRREFGRHGVSLARSYDWRAIAQQVLTLPECARAAARAPPAPPNIAL
jgi:D-inositol-3-phosphate glycosyltransferase